MNSKSSTRPAASGRPIGTSDDHVLVMMRRFGWPMTRENYLEMAYMGNPPAKLGPEEEAELPPQFRKQSADG
jgi:hypothetical protein